MRNISYKFVKNESYQFFWIFVSLCIYVAYFTSILKKIGSKWLQNYLSYWTTLIKSYKYVKWVSYKYV
jgi:hypothetical protein